MILVRNVHEKPYACARMPLSMRTLGLSLLTFLVLFLIRLTEGNSQIKTIKSSSVWGKVSNFVTLIFLFICLLSLSLV